MIIRTMKLQGVILGVTLWAVGAMGGVVEDYAEKLAPLIDPAKLAALGERAANPRVQKAVYWLATGRTNKANPGKVLDVALQVVVARKDAVTV